MTEVYGYLVDGPGVGKTSFSPSVWNKPWVLSKEEEKTIVSILPDVLKDFGRQDIIVIDFLYRSYIKQLNGIILNEEEDLNTQLQVSSFLGALYHSVQNKFLVLVLCPDDLMVKWHYFMSKCSSLQVKMVTPNMVPEDFDQNAGIALLLSFTNIKLAEYLKEYDFFSVVIDNFDEVATKLVIRKLQGGFNIGVTTRNFYSNPDQKLQWTMLNWANPGSVGKLADFYKIDDDNFANSRNNYKEWWFHLTWSFCDTFVKPTLDEKEHLDNMLREWGKTHHLNAYLKLKNDGKSSKGKRKVRGSPEFQNEPSTSKDNQKNNRPKRVYSKNTTKTNFNRIPYKNAPRKGTKIKNSVPSDSSDSSDTIVDDSSSYTILDPDDTDSSENDEPPIGASPKSDKIIEEKTSLKNSKVSNEVDGKNPSYNDDNDSSNYSMSSGEELLCSLVRTNQTKLQKSPRKMAKMDYQNESDSIDESDHFLMSVASTSSASPLLKNRRRATRIFDTILKDDDEQTQSKSLTQMELDLTETGELEDVPSESDNFLKSFNKTSKDESSDRSEVKEVENESENSDVSSTSKHVDVDTLMAEVMEMVGKN